MRASLVVAHREVQEEDESETAKEKEDRLPPGRKRPRASTVRRDPLAREILLALLTRSHSWEEPMLAAKDGATAPRTKPVACPRV